MTSAAGKYAAKAIMKKSFKDYEHKEPAGEQDTLYAYVPNPKKPGKRMKVKRQIPDYIPEEDAIILAKVRRRAYRYDLSLFNFAGIRFGTSAVWGLVPVAGDTLDIFVALMLFRTASKISCGLGTAITIQMLINIILDYVVGLVPILGDLADAAFKANSKNCRLLEKRLDEMYKPKDKSRRREPHPQLPPPTSPATVWETFSDDEQESGVVNHRATEPQRPPPARTNERSQKSGRWSWGGRRERQPDVEMAQDRPPRRP